MTTPRELTFRKVRVTDKGQISIPVDVQRKIGISRGDELLLIAKGHKIVLEKSERMAKLLEDEFADVQAISEASLSRLWLNEDDEVWNKYLEESTN
ncbi:MAG: AbrB/MazE/SpoVT family DNA-binding domain-containing protein [Nitrososphaerota archaeon]|jgi:AbrB family looped-hinge helix DNA binding protein|nr:AbrB/MazE/SpoVT family DNA-binding domain-containing protein [Nitrososphaerota archaeon]